MSVLVFEQSIIAPFLYFPAAGRNIRACHHPGLEAAIGLVAVEVVLIVDVPEYVREVGWVVGTRALELAPGDGLDGYLVDLRHAMGTVESWMPKSHGRSVVICRN